MKKLSYILTLTVFGPMAASWAQVYAPNESGVSLSQWYTIVPDVEASKKFWAVLGGTPIQVDGTAVMKFPGVLLFITKGTPTGGSVGTGVNHIGFGVPNVLNMAAKLEGAGYKVDRVGISPLNGQHVMQTANPDGLEVEITEEAGVDPYPRIPDGLSIESNHMHLSFGPVNEAGRKEMQEWYVNVNTPDGVMIEITEEAGVAPYPKLPPGVPVESNHMHMFVAKEFRKDMQSWYVKMFGGEPWEMRGEYIVSLPGVKFLRIAPCGSEYSACPETGSAPTKGRALDHVGFEVKNLQAFCKKLEAEGVKFVQPYSKSRHKSFASAELLDPWGTSIELTEGLSRF